MPRKRDDRRSPERTRTDKSLREERANTDEAIKGDRGSSERDAEGVIDKARALADAAVKAERSKTDKKAAMRPRPARKGAVAGQRVEADRAVRGERARADKALRSHLQGRADALEALLVHERAATDAYLLTERVRSDKDVSHRDDFLGMVAHDVRNLLNLVVLTLATLQPDDEGSPPHVTAAAHRIQRYVARMNRLIGDLLDITRIDKGKLGVEPVEGDAAALLVEAADAFQAAALEQGVTLAAEAPAGPLPAVFDHDRVLQVFANLFSNAIKFTPRGGRIDVAVRKTGGMLRFGVSDTGVGIPAAMRKRIFERFWQVGKDDRRGMGLGLYISKCIVESHGGRIWAEGTVGKGSQLYFTIPVTRTRSHRKTARGGAPREKGSKRNATLRAVGPRRKRR